jgi:1-deoxy-D-xylulose-5-phosphate synthase
MSEAIQIALSSSSPVAIRYPRGNVPAKDEIVQNQKSTEEARSKVQILAVGDQIIKAIKVKELLQKDGIHSEVMPIMNVKPFAVLAESDSLTVSIENGVVSGGFGESVGAAMKFGWPDALVCHGTVDELEREHGFDAEAIAQTIRQKLSVR